MAVGKNRIVPRNARSPTSADARTADKDVGTIIYYWRRLGQAVMAASLTNCGGVVDVKAKARAVRYDSFEEEKLIPGVEGAGDDDTEAAEADYLFLHPYDMMRSSKERRGDAADNVTAGAGAGAGAKKVLHGEPSPRDVLTFHQQNCFSQRSSSTTSTASTAAVTTRPLLGAAADGGDAAADDFLLPTHRVHPLHHHHDDKRHQLTPVREAAAGTEEEGGGGHVARTLEGGEPGLDTISVATEVAVESEDADDDDDDPLAKEILSRGASPTPPYSSVHEADIHDGVNGNGAAAGGAGANSFVKDAHILSRMRMNMNRLADVLVAKKSSTVTVGKHALRLREVLSQPGIGAEPGETHVDVFRCRSDPENFNIALKAITLRDDGRAAPMTRKLRSHDAKIASLVRAFNEIEVLEELKFEKNAVHLVSSALRAEAIDRMALNDGASGSGGHGMTTAPGATSGTAQHPSEARIGASGSVSVLMMMEWCGGGSLRDLIAKQHRALQGSASNGGGADLQICEASGHTRPEVIPEQLIVNIARAVCNPLLKMHTRFPKQASHRNVTADSVLITSRGVVKLSGFGHSVIGATEVGVNHESKRARLIDDISRIHPAVRAPEQTLALNQLQADTKAGRAAGASTLVLDTPIDVWQLGCLIYALAYGTLPFGEHGLCIKRQPFDKMDAVDAIRAAIYEGNANRARYSEELAELIEKLVKFDASDRPSIGAVATMLDDHHEHLELKKFEDLHTNGSIDGGAANDRDVWATAVTPRRS